MRALSEEDGLRWLTAIQNSLEKEANMLRQTGPADVQPNADDSARDDVSRGDDVTLAADARATPVEIPRASLFGMMILIMMNLTMMMMMMMRNAAD